MKIYIVAFCSFILLASCKPKQKITAGDNSRTSVAWQGVYTGILPCADCEGIQTRLVLNNNLSYLLETRYNGRDENVRQSQGKFSWSANGSKITLDNDKQIYQVGENQIFHLDQKGNRISGNLAQSYVLTKENTEITGKHWKLVEIDSKLVETDHKKPFMVFSKEENRVNGNNSCNSFFGTFEISGPDKIKFSQMGMTRMACIGNTIEDLFMKALDNTISFAVSDGKLILNDAKGKVIARFTSDFFAEKK
jgi:heat shock protein HslJ